MNKYDEIAANVIDIVLEKIEELYPEIKPKKEYLEESENASILFGAEYYNIESEISDMIREEVMSLLTNGVCVKIGDRIHVGDMGDAIVTDESNPDGIEVYYVIEEDDTLSWQLIPNEHSDTSLTSRKVIPDEPVE